MSKSFINGKLIVDNQIEGQVKVDSKIRGEVGITTAPNFPNIPLLFP